MSNNLKKRERTATGARDRGYDGQSEHQIRRTSSTATIVAAARNKNDLGSGADAINISGLLV